MSLTVKHLNADSTFLLTFSPLNDCPPSPGYQTSNGNLTILVDPWLSGPSQVWHAKFALTKHTVPSCINHLSELPRPDIVLISQDKPDHCHEATLRQLDPSLRDTIIFAVPAAAKRIRGWKYFDPSNVRTLPVFSKLKFDSIVRFRIHSSIPGAIPGEATIAFIPTKRDLTGLHNALGITYRPPSNIYSSPATPDFADSSTTYSTFSLPVQDNMFSDLSLPLSPPTSPFLTDSTAPSTPASTNNHFSLNSNSSSISSTFSSNPTSMSGRPKTLSVIYAPHGVTYPHIFPYASSHLVLNSALPLTALLHSFDRVQNLWWLGGNISAGLPGGLEIAQNLLTRCWISAHDEDKESSGVSVAKLITTKFSAQEVREMIERGRRGGKVATDVMVLDAGEEIVLRA